MNQIQDKIKEIIFENEVSVAASVIEKIMLELASYPSSLSTIETVDRTIDLVCEETFG